jgi:hypothetical protein
LWAADNLQINQQGYCMQYPLLARNKAHSAAQVHAHAKSCSIHPQVLAATRIHNRHLRTQFAKHMDADDAFEYLFFCNPAGVVGCVRAGKGRQTVWSMHTYIALAHVQTASGVAYQATCALLSCS